MGYLVYKKISIILETNLKGFLLYKNVAQLIPFIKMLSLKMPQGKKLAVYRVLYTRILTES